MAGPAGKKSTGATSGRVQKKAPAKSAATSKASTGSGLDYTGPVKGATQMPAARVKRIIKEDKDVRMVSNDAVFVISVAAELFLESFTAKAFNLAKIQKRKTISYKDLATAVTQHDSLEFLQDVVPKTMTLSAALEKQIAAKEQEESGGMEDDDDGEQEADGSADENEDGEERSGDDEDEDANSSSRPASDDEELSAPDDMEED
ncbi:hypothetical protein BGZ99_009617 [Dissophora globulifera]|uniref:Transcription factor CBF/NF-Y/archaeal histone domain-containing protein n=1 Tax=Dissophora globulifera TaxID=979702 RepID=A0A9P6UXS9_9FUNG|nr:hypothetical protein BGZ99_009617 [Dissophora globulifera]